MGVHDYTCNVCGAPSTYECHEADGGACDADGFGQSDVVLELFFFGADDAPPPAASRQPALFEAARAEARRVEVRRCTYDWGRWELEPSLNYRQVAMNDGDPLGLWQVVRPARPEGDDESSPLTLAIPDGEVVWVVNYCPGCFAAFAAAPAPRPEEVCLLHLQDAARHLRLRPSPDKAALLRQVRDRVAQRRP